MSSAMTCSMMVWSWWSVSAAGIGSGMSVRMVWWRQAGSSSPWRGGASRRTRRTINRAVTVCVGLLVKAV